mgnify:CR=1 FL=1
MTKNSPLSALLKALSTWTEANETETIIDRKRDCVTLKMASPDQKTIQQIKTAAQRQKRPFSLRFENGHTLIESKRSTPCGSWRSRHDAGTRSHCQWCL